MVLELAIKIFADEVGCAAGDVDVLADQVTVDSGDEILGVEVNVFDLGIELGADVVAQPFRVHADLEVAQWRDAGAATFRHFFTADGDEAVDVQLVRCFATRELEGGWPEEGVEINNVLANEVNLLGAAVRINERIVIQTDCLAVGLERSQVTHRGIEPDIKVLAGCIRDVDAEVRCIARNIPVSELGFTLAVTQPLAGFGQYLRL